MNNLMNKFEQILNNTVQISKEDYQKLLLDIKNVEVDLFKNGYFSNTTSINNVNDLILFYESLCFSMIQLNELYKFELNFKRLRHFYIKANHASENRIHLTGLYLTYLFSENKNNELNLTLESLNMDQKNNNHIIFISELVKYFKIGSYNNALQYSQNPPSNLYKIITCRIIEAIRVEIFKNILSTIEYINLKDLANILQIDNENSLNSFLQSMTKILPEEKYYIEDNQLKIFIKRNQYKCNYNSLLEDCIEKIEDFDKIFS